MLDKTNDDFDNDIDSVLYQNIIGRFAHFEYVPTISLIQRMFKLGYRTASKYHEKYLNELETK